MLKRSNKPKKIIKGLQKSEKVKIGGRVLFRNLKDGDISYFISYSVNGKSKVKKIGTRHDGWHELNAYHFRERVIYMNRVYSHGKDDFDYDKLFKDLLNLELKKRNPF
jgi:hypothetical protein